MTTPVEQPPREEVIIQEVPVGDPLLNDVPVSGPSLPIDRFSCGTGDDSRHRHIDEEHQHDSDPSKPHYHPLDKGGNVTYDCVNNVLHVPKLNP